MLTWWLQSNIDPMRFELVLAEVGHRAAHHDGGVLADLHRVVLGVDAEGVEAHRLEDVSPMSRRQRP